MCIALVFKFSDCVLGQGVRSFCQKPALILPQGKNAEWVNRARKISLRYCIHMLSALNESEPQSNAYSQEQIVFTIRDRQPVQASVSLLQGTDTLHCPNTAVQLGAQFSGGEGQLSCAWEDGSTHATRWDTVSADRTYIFYAWDECVADSVMDSLRLYVRPLSPLVLF
jgi:hypothetical protein